MAGRWPLSGAHLLWRALAGVACVLLAVLVWLLATESGLRAGLRAASWASDGQLSAREASGRLLGAARLGELRLDTPSLRLSLRDLEVDWKPAALWAGRLEVVRLAAAELRVASAPGEDSGPPAAPASLRLPLAVEIGQLSLERLVLEAWDAQEEPVQPFAIEQIRAALRSDGVQHHLGGLQLALPGVRLTVDELALSGEAPFALQGSGRLQGSVEERVFAAQFDLSGDLPAPRLRLAAQGEGLNGELDVLAAPFEAMPLRQLRVDLGEVDPAAFVAGAPRAALRLSAELNGGDESGEWTLAGPLRVTNGMPGSMDAQLLPFTTLAGELHWRASETRVEQLRIDLPGDGAIEGRLAWRPAPQDEDAEPEAAALLPGTLEAALQLRAVDPARLHAALPPLGLGGRIDAQAAGTRQTVNIDLSAVEARLAAAATLDSADPAAPRFDLTATLRGLAVQRLLAAAPDVRLGADIAAQGVLAERPNAELRLRLVDARAQGQALEGGGHLALEGERLRAADLAFTLGGNRLALDGAWGAPGDRLHAVLAAPRLDALGLGLGGRADLEAELGGTLAAPSGRLRAYAEALRLPGGWRVGGLNAQGQLDAGLDGPFVLAAGLSALQSAGQDGQAGDTLLETAHLSVQGTRRAHQAELAAARAEDALELALEGGLDPAAQDGPQWRGVLRRLESTGRFPARLEGAAVLTAGTQRVELAPARIEAGERGRIELRQTLWTPEQILLRGQLSGLAFGLETRADGRPRRGPGPLTLGAEWNLRLDDSAEGELRVFREAGDLEVGGELSTRLGLEHFEAWLTARDNRLALSVDARGSELGTVSAALTALAERTAEGGWQLAPDGALLGSARLNMPSIAWVGRLAQESVDTEGSLSAEFSLGGTPADPQASGTIRGEALAIALVDQGLHLSGGELLAEFDRDRLRLTRLNFVSPNRVRPRDTRLPIDRLTATPGRLEASGEIELDSGAGRFDFRADRLPLLQRTDRWLILSGQGTARSTWTTLALEAAFGADAGYVELADTPAPSLSDDVVVLGREKAGGAGLALSADVRVDLGRHLYLSAYGVDTRLAGELRLRLAQGLPLNATGSISTAGGVFRGYGQNLTIERGLVNFQGALDNPGLNVVALRKGLAVEAGVAIGGTARRPQVRLVSEPSVPDPEKLSWIVLGRAPDAAAGADMGLLLPAAQALLGGPGGGMTDQLSRSLGFDEFTIGQGEVGGVSRRPTSRVVGSGTVVDDGTVSGQVLTLGKRLSSDMFLSFEQSLGGAESLVKLTYQLSRRVSLVARGGTDNAVDIYYTLAFR
ncbi:DUF490 domain-containing protein [Pseudothauera nasutitermitis]|uniref:DUF490 domain-containing protein n=1 Tax=Pseudothauera nasutitermitis TaxID=2565930 RepID=A0A4S4AUP0_9RHOO|nr:translocation/assembly module TamB domain-containing protein [Pseudothauera nasutitermitis]THF63687.1 DUF490 domain-containing protein [Pseudothauera nasutitermitis]